jgi:hypothetical protein
MAFLKSSQITGLSAKDVDVRGFTQAANIKLGERAYTEHEVLLADSYSIIGDITVSEDLILSKLSDDGDAITLTGDTTTRTITGSGSIQGATLAQTPNATLTGMTGVLDNSVQDNVTRLGTVTTGTIGSGVTFPVGHVLQIVFGSSIVSSGGSSTTAGMGNSVSAPAPTFDQGMTAGIQYFTPRFSTSKILVQTNNIFVCETSNVSDHAHLWLQDNEAQTVLGFVQMYACLNDNGGSEHGGIMCLNHAFNSWGTSRRALEFRIGHDQGGNSTNFKWNPYYASGSRNTSSTGQFHWTLTEIAQ